MATHMTNRFKYRDLGCSKYKEVFMMNKVCYNIYQRTETTENDLS
jgi:hypothetical protein